MGLEVGTYVSDLVETNPLSGDLKSAGDDHLRLIKGVLKTTFPNASKALYMSTFVAKTANYTILAADANKTITVDATGGAVTLTLPSLAAGDDGWQVRVIKIDASANNVLFGGTINGRADYNISGRYNNAWIFWSGTAWYSFAGEDIPGLSELTAPASGDFLRIHDISAADELKITLANMLEVVNDLAAETTPDSAADYVLLYDTVGASARKLLLANIPVILPRGYIDGCTMSNGADTTNDINISAGVCRDSTNAFNITIAASVKQLDANWVAGTSGGGRNSAAGITDTTYHVHAVATAAGVSGIYFHTSTTVATVIAALNLESGGGSYVYARRIGSIIRSGSTILQFVQDSDLFELTTPVLDENDTALTTSATTLTLESVPNGVSVRAVFNATSSLTGGSAGIYFSALDTNHATPVVNTTSAPGFSIMSSVSITGSPQSRTGGQVTTRTNTSRQIRAAASASMTVGITTIGWWDKRGKDA